MPPLTARVDPPRWPVWLALAVVVVIKMVAIRDHEIAAINSPLDDLWFLRKAEGVYWGRHRYGPDAFIKEPVYPLFVALSAGLGLPLRLTTEAAYLGAGLFLARTLVRGWARVPMFAVIALHPLSLTTFERATYDAVYATLLLTVCALLARHLRARAADIAARGGGWILGVALAGLWLARPERVLTCALIAGAVLVEAMVVRRRLPRGGAVVGELWRAWRRPLAGLTAVTLAVMTLNFARWRTFAITDMSAPGYGAAYRALVSIVPPQPIRCVPVTAAARRLAYAHCPVLRGLEPYLEGDLGRTWSGFGGGEAAERGEIGGGWFCWALRDAVAAAGHYRSARESERFYSAIAEEIAAAQEAGHLPRRAVWSTFVDPGFATYRAFLLPSWREQWRRCWRGEMPPPVADDLKTEMFERVAWRRSGGRSGPTVLIEDGGLAPEARVVGASACTADGSAVPTRVAGDDGRTLLSWAAGSGVATVVIHTGGGAHRLPVDRLLVKGLLSELPGAPRVTQVRGLRDSVGAVLRRGLWRAHGWIMPGLLYIGVAGLGVVLMLDRAGRSGRALPAALAAVVAGVALARLALFALIDASSYSAGQDRYLFPASVSLSVVAVWAGLLAVAPRSAGWTESLPVSR